MSGPSAGELNPYAPPTASLEHDVPPWAGLVGFRSVKPLAQAITWLLAIYAVGKGFAIAYTGAAISAMQRLLDGIPSASAEGESIALRLTVIGGMLAVLWLAVLVLFCMFVFRANKNLRALQVIEPQFTPRWAVGVFFVPILNFYKPYQAMREIWWGSSPDPDAIVVASSLRGPSLLKWWWGLYLASFIHVEGLKHGSGWAAFIASAERALVGHVLQLIAVVLAIAVVRGVAARQDARQRVRPAGQVSPPYPSSGR